MSRKAKESQQAITPPIALQTLKDGNARTQTLANIKPAVAAVPGYETDRSSGNASFVQVVADKNVELTIKRIRERSSILQGMTERGEIGLTGAMYDVHTGRVNFT